MPAPTLRTTDIGSSATMAETARTAAYSMALITLPHEPRLEVGSGFNRHGHGQHGGVHVAAHCILLCCHHHRGTGITRRGADVFDIARRIPVVIRKRQLTRDVVAERSQCGKEPLGT